MSDHNWGRVHVVHVPDPTFTKDGLLGFWSQFGYTVKAHQLGPEAWLFEARLATTGEIAASLCLIGAVAPPPPDPPRP